MKWTTAALAVIAIGAVAYACAKRNNCLEEECVCTPEEELESCEQEQD